MIRFRGDIEGLRAVAVLMVILDHLRIRGFHGGFTGVDVFFVISGYLITSLLAAEYAEKAAAGGNGSISIGHFYVRRAKRILPAALTVLGAVVVASHLLLNVLRVQQVQHDALWAAFFGSNVNFIRQSTDYFAAGFVSSSPFGHYWSLSVEEQFYFVWPALFLLVVGLHGLSIRGRWVGWRLRLGIALVLVGIASLAWSITATASNPASAYYSTFTRAWELALGALIAVATTGATTIGRRRATAASVTGVALLLVGWIIIDASSRFPGYVALLPTLGAGLLILGGISDALPAPNRILSVAPMRFIGRISYSLYLWHWPLIVFAAALYPNASSRPATRAAILALTIVIATVSYYAIEQPFRRQSFPRPSARLTWFPAALGRRRFRGLKVASGVIAVAAISVGIGAGLASALSVSVPQLAASDVEPQIKPAILITRSSPAAKRRTVKRTRSPARAETAASHWEAKVKEAMTLRSLPANLQPLDQHLTKTYPHSRCDDYARLEIAAHLQECAMWGNPNAPNVAAITGDSHAAMWVATVMGALDPKEWSLYNFTRSWCGWSAKPEAAYGQNKDCPGLQAQTLTELKKLHVDLLFLSESSDNRGESPGDALASYGQATKTVVVIGDTPRHPSFVSCLHGATDISACHGELAAADNSRAVSAQQHLAWEFNDHFIDTTQWFCRYKDYATLTCPPVIDDAPAFMDDNHITAAIATKLGPVLRQDLREANILRPRP